MRNYLSFGGGVNSVALHLLLLDEGIDFESVFVHHGTDWPETYQYVAGFQWWLKLNGHKPITVLRPHVKRKGKFYNNLYACYFENGLLPLRFPRWCTKDFKITTINNYIKTPCFQFIGIDSGESHRAKITTYKGVENRYPLIEYEINRAGCIDIIKAHGLPEPMKSGCYICPFQRKSQFQMLRAKHPELFCNVEKLETNDIRIKKRNGKSFSYIKNIPIRKHIDENQGVLFEQDEYPPCLCGL